MNSGERVSVARRVWRASADYLGLVLFLVVLFIGFGLASRRFLSLGVLRTIANQVPHAVVLAVAMTYVLTIAGIDLSVGSVMAMSGAVAALLLTQTRLPLGVVLAAALAVALVAGLWNGVLVAFLRLQPIVATLILLVAGRGVAQIVTGGQIVTFHQASFEFIGNGVVLGLPFPVFLAAAVAVATIVVARVTVAGLYVEAVGDNERASRLAGLWPGLVKTLVYGFSGLCSGVAGLVAAADIRAADVMKCGEYIELDAILAVVIGGTSFSGGRARIVGSLVGALIMQTLTTTIRMLNVPAHYTLVVKAVTVVVVCALDSQQFRALLRRLVRRRRVAA